MMHQMKAKCARGDRLAVAAVLIAVASTIPLWAQFGPTAAAYNVRVDRYYSHVYDRSPRGGADYVAYRGESLEGVATLRNASTTDAIQVSVGAGAAFEPEWQIFEGP